MAVITVSLEDQGIDRSVTMCSHVIKASGKRTGITNYPGGARIHAEKIRIPCPNAAIVIRNGKPYCKSHAPPER